MRQKLAVQDLKRLVIAEIDRHLGDHGIVLDISIEPRPTEGSGPNWGISALREEADMPALRQAVAKVLPLLQDRFDASFD